MPAFIVVYEDYSPEAFRSASAVASRFSAYFLDKENTIPVTAAALRREIKECRTAKLYADGRDDWSFKVFST